MPVQLLAYKLNWTVGDPYLARIRGVFSVVCWGTFDSDCYVKYEAGSWWVKNKRAFDWTPIERSGLAKHVGFLENERRKFLSTVLPVPHPDVRRDIQAAAASYGPRLGFAPLPHWASAY